MGLMGGLTGRRAAGWYGPIVGDCLLESADGRRSDRSRKTEPGWGGNGRWAVGVNGSSERRSMVRETLK